MRNSQRPLVGSCVAKVVNDLLIICVACFCEPLALATGLEGLRYHTRPAASAVGSVNEQTLKTFGHSGQGHNSRLNCCGALVPVQRLVESLVVRLDESLVVWPAVWREQMARG